mmetsp:Transcript_15106/g.19595  ORF Transcript_15106/g.19595 Transcript_15106/m.19595 type:complete len:267 (+) Transcript_15106:274-1074(+)
MSNTFRRRGSFTEVQPDGSFFEVDIERAYVEHLEWDWVVLAESQYVKCVELLSLDIIQCSASPTISKALNKWVKKNLSDDCFLKSNLHLLRSDKQFIKTEPHSSRLYAYYMEQYYETSLSHLFYKLLQDYWDYSDSDADLSTDDQLISMQQCFYIDLKKLGDDEEDVYLFLNKIWEHGESLYDDDENLDYDSSIQSQSEYNEMCEMTRRIFIRKNLPSIGNYMDRQNGFIIKTHSKVNNENSSSWFNMFGFNHEHIIDNIESNKGQ